MDDSSGLGDWEDTLFFSSTTRTRHPQEPEHGDGCSISPPSDHEGLPVIPLHSNHRGQDRHQAQIDVRDAGNGYGDGTIRAGGGFRRASKVLRLVLRFLWCRIRKFYDSSLRRWDRSIRIPSTINLSTLVVMGLMLTAVGFHRWRKGRKQDSFLLLRMQDMDQEIRSLQIQISHMKELPIHHHLDVPRKS